MTIKPDASKGEAAVRAYALELITTGTAADIGHRILDLFDGAIEKEEFEATEPRLKVAEDLERVLAELPTEEPRHAAPRTPQQALGEKFGEAVVALAVSAEANEYDARMLTDEIGSTQFWEAVEARLNGYLKSGRNA